MVWSWWWIRPDVGMIAACDLWLQVPKHLDKWRIGFIMVLISNSDIGALLREWICGRILVNWSILSALERLKWLMASIVSITNFSDKYSLSTQVTWKQQFSKANMACLLNLTSKLVTPLQIEITCWWTDAWESVSQLLLREKGTGQLHFLQTWPFSGYWRAANLRRPVYRS